MVKEKLTSRKLWLAIIMVIEVLTSKEIDPQVAEMIAAGIVGIYIVVEGIIDALRFFKK
jgi:surface polysaccharide O-acyltransferase-like enzyme